MKQTTHLEHEKPKLTAALRGCGGFSMSEIVVTISIIAILATIVMVNMGSSFESARASLARERVEMLNNALHSWAMARNEMTFNRLDGSTADEMKVLRDLQYRHPDDDLADLNSPYIAPEYNPPTSSNTQHYRIRWNSRRYELLAPGTIGSGIQMIFDGSDMTDPFPFPPNYQSGGR